MIFQPMSFAKKMQKETLCLKTALLRSQNRSKRQMKKKNRLTQPIKPILSRILSMLWLKVQTVLLNPNHKKMITPLKRASKVALYMMTSLNRLNQNPKRHTTQEDGFLKNMICFSKHSESTVKIGTKLVNILRQEMQLIVDLTHKNSSQS